MSELGDGGISRRRFLEYLGSTAMAAMGPPRARPTRRPNIIVLVTDDQRWDALSCMGNPVLQTPHLDRLARHGVLFANHFCTSAICMSSRASMLTGMHTRRHQLTGFHQPLAYRHLALSYPALLRKAGYRIGFVGKWGAGVPIPKQLFHYWAGFSGQGTYFHPVDGQMVHLERLLADQAIRFLQDSAADQPFCLSVGFKAPHSDEPPDRARTIPLPYKEKAPRDFLYDPVFESLYRDVEIPLPPTAHPRHFAALPPFVQRTLNRAQWESYFSTPQRYQETLKDYYRLVVGVDVAVGRILHALEHLRLAHNTVILFTSDNGFLMGEHGLGGKWLMYEESIRVPFIVFDPRLPRAIRGQRREEMTLNIDLAPTVLDLAGLPVPHPMQGRSLRPLMEGRAQAWRNVWLYEQAPYYLPGRWPILNVEGVRTPGWKYVCYLDQRPVKEALYDLRRDPRETRNLAGDPAHQSVLRILRRRWRRLRIHAA